ncbi:hypothetical protein ACV16U_22960, partial [Escherichia coli]
MRKTLIGCMVATALATVSSAHAQVFSYSFTDTNKAVRNIKPATQTYLNGFAPIFPDTCYHLTHYWPAAADIPV